MTKEKFYIPTKKNNRIWELNAQVRYRNKKAYQKTMSQQYPPPQTLNIRYPDAEVQFQAEVDVGYYYSYGNDWMHIHVTSEDWKKDTYHHSKEFDNCLVILDYDKHGGLIGIEIIADDTELGDLKQ